MRAAVVRPLVVLALVAAAWANAPAAMAQKGGTIPPTKQGRGGTIGAHITRDNRMQLFSSTDTVLATGQAQVFQVAYTYDNLGLLVSETRTTTVDGVVTDSEDEALTYDTAHRLAQVVTVTDPDGAGPIPPSTRVDTLVRNSRHELVSIVTTIDDTSDGTIDSTSTESRTFDGRGRKISSVVTDGNIVTTTSYTYDSHGNMLSQTVSTDDLTTPQSPDSTDTSTMTYSQPHDLVTTEAEQLTTYDAQGHAQPAGSSDTTISRNNKGYITGSTFAGDTNGDGVIDTTGTSTSTYDKQGNLQSETSTSTDSSGVFVSGQVLTDDAKGNPVQEVAQDTLNGVLLDRLVEVSTYNKFGEDIKQVTSIDNNGDGTVDSIETYSQSYDNKARVTGAQDAITDGNGVLLYGYTQTNVYGKVTETETRLTDTNGDGVVDETEVTVVPL